MTIMHVSVSFMTLIDKDFPRRTSPSAVWSFMHDPEYDQVGLESGRINISAMLSLWLWDAVRWATLMSSAMHSEQMRVFRNSN